uniref:Uncharacterized protein n=1 Tax=viral metagenome TaxID=1070528 RepID=A0A6C0BJI5_9ZZZZ
MTQRVIRTFLIGSACYGIIYYLLHYFSMFTWIGSKFWILWGMDVCMMGILNTGFMGGHKWWTTLFNNVTQPALPQQALPPTLPPPQALPPVLPSPTQTSLQLSPQHLHPTPPTVQTAQTSYPPPAEKLEIDLLTENEDDSDPDLTQEKNSNPPSLTTEIPPSTQNPLSTEIPQTGTPETENQVSPKLTSDNIQKYVTRKPAAMAVTNPSIKSADLIL